MKPIPITALLLSTAMFLAPAFVFAEPTTQPATTQPAAVEKIDVDHFDALRADTSNIILDVRTPEEYSAGHVPGAVNVPFSKAGFADAIQPLDKSKTYLVYCHSGKRSFLSTQLMRSAGFDHLYNFNGGIIAWQKAGKAMETRAPEPATKPA